MPQQIRVDFVAGRRLGQVGFGTLGDQPHQAHQSAHSLEVDPMLELPQPPSDLTHCTANLFGRDEQIVGFKWLGDRSK